MRWFLLATCLFFCSELLAKTVTLSCDAPTTRENGEAIAVTEIEKYLFVYWMDGDESSYSVDDNDPSDCGTTLDIDTTGDWNFTVYTHANDGTVSGPSETITQYIAVESDVDPPVYSYAIPSKPSIFAQRIQGGEVMATAVTVARYLLDEASSGTSPATLTDDTGNGNNLSMDYGSSSDAEWTSNGVGNGLHFTETPGTDNTAIARIDNVAANGNIGPAFENATEAWGVAVIDDAAGADNGCRLFQIGLNQGNGEFALIKMAAANEWHIRWNRDNSNGNVSRVPFTFTQSASGTVDVIAVQVDMGQTAATDAFRVYVNGTEVDVGTPVDYSQGAALTEVNSSDRDFVVGNRGSNSRNYQGKLYYLEIGTGILTSEQLTTLSTNLAADHDTDWAAGSAVTPVIEHISVSTFQTSVQANIDKSIDSALEAIGLTTYQAAMEADIDSNINAALADINVSNFQAAVQSDVDTAVPGALENISVAANSAIISTGFNTQINAQLESISLGGFLASIASNTTLAASVESIGITVHPANVVLGSAIAAVTESISIQANQSTVLIASSIGATLESILLTELNAQVSLGAAIDAALESISITEFGSVITLDTGVSATLESLTLSTFSAVITSPASAITAAGLEYTIDSALAHYTLPVNKLHFTFRS